MAVGDHTNGANPRDEGTLYTINLSSSGPRESEGYVSMPKIGGCVQTNTAEENIIDLFRITRECYPQPPQTI